jgi:predicted metal-dependent phosphoesterase TrpH
LIFLKNLKHTIKYSGHMIEGKADLHIHTNASDGKYDPEEVIRLAAKAGLKAVAITDHDTYDGYFRAKAAGSDLGVEVIPGIEITADYKGRECHILGYGFETGNAGFKQFVQAQKKRRYNRAKKMLSNLQKFGYDITIDEIFAEYGTMNLSRNHIAGLMVKKGYTTNTKAVFEKWLGNNGPAYYKIEYESVAAVIEIIKKAGGLSVLAHPGIYYLPEDIDYLIKNGINGMECIHPSHNYELQKQYRDICLTHGLIETGGSDFHGFKKEDHANFGTVVVDYTKATMLKKGMAETIQ